MINICLFEDKGYKKLYPLSYARACYELKIGGITLKEKVDRFFKDINITLHCRDYLSHTMKEKFPELVINKITGGSPCLFLNSRVLLEGGLYREIISHPQDHSFMLTHKGEALALYLKEALIPEMTQLLENIPSSEDIIHFFREKTVCKELETVSIIQNTWDILTYQTRGIRTDFRLLNQSGIIKGDLSPNTVIYNEDQVFIDQKAKVEDFVVIDARKGPVIIEEDAVIQPFSYLEGPLYIGKKAVILGAKLKSSSIGPYCKIGGEVNHSQFYANSNKAHEGYIGHSVIGEWVNLGAGTTTSNLNLNYSSVRVEENGNTVDSKEQFLGSIIGDHVKTGIGSLLNTGTHIGFGTAIYGGGMPQSKNIPALCWGKPNDYKVHDLDRFMTTLKTVMKRRRQKPSDAQVALLKLLHEHEHSDVLTAI